MQDGLNHLLAKALTVAHLKAQLHVVYSPWTLSTCTLAYCRIELHSLLDQWEQKQYLSRIGLKNTLLSTAGSRQAGLQHTTPQGYRAECAQSRDTGCAYESVKVWPFV